MTGILWMLVTGLCFVAVTALVKWMGPGMPPSQAAFLRYMLGMVFLIPMLKDVREANLTPRQWKLFTLRGLLHSVGVSLWFFAMTRIPIAELTAINYLAPVFVSIGAAIFLGERLAARRIFAVVVALVGTAIILRPGFREVANGHIAMLAAAAVFSGSYLLAKILSDEAKPTVVVFMMTVFVSLGLAPLAAIVWVTPTWEQIGILALVAVFAQAGHYTMTLAFAAAPVTVTQPITFLQLVWATLLGMLVFSEPVDIYVVLGGVLILASVTFITWREAQLKRRPITPTINATKV
ncbi:DMT family transporter [Pseudosulfitobacter pseudonitzschiae]|uniref:DMT family transporter n=1 Tax=Pseudosulfitobacter pseudonitzschiae TaxID=1402135 RepID=UPI001CC9407F|nr:DMT family transporter [Pseudosulfitobacter pseudonitzschiae]MCA0135789.1 DMT family transporter [Pseudosulfitobacter pseudonitzschiae]MCD2327247.1 DMT family transporter [Pseudosulfitobacter pseudonitzschiae]MCI2213737.1 DMT family transporter [Pseudosulfitobacter pseudonitzschiae]UFE27371.1 DMT family transporter [Pseudosulfitobacter pseudonitzschiae]UFE32095.1 DMT family transporter [Pseudosulfitobacter pseudonitzschiae]